VIGASLTSPSTGPVAVARKVKVSVPNARPQLNAAPVRLPANGSALTHPAIRLTTDGLLTMVDSRTLPVSGGYPSEKLAFLIVIRSHRADRGIAWSGLRGARY
jgi:hypothetical protein